MKIIPLIAAAAAALLTIPAASAATASAPSTVAVGLADATVGGVIEQDRRYRDRDRDRRWERRHGRRAHWRTVCTRKWRNGHRVRVCRKVRGWRR